MENSAEPAIARRRLLQALGGGVLLLPALTACAARPRTWGAFARWRDAGISEDGRVIDHGHADRRSTSEGQAYALFIALVADDRVLFRRLLDWTRDNLAGGDLARRLPAWLWGHDPTSDEWRVLDANPASDADLWLAYTLVEAAARWQEPELAALARNVLRQVAQQEVARLPGLGAMLLPAPVGFGGRGQWRLNPSYLPLPVLRRIAGFDPDGPWAEIAGNSLRLLYASAPRGFAPDWLAWRGGRVAVDPVKGAVGSYDAIRTYLWAGMMDAGQPGTRRALAILHGPAGLIARGQAMPERIDTIDGAASGPTPPGFNAALLPYLEAVGMHAHARRLRGALPAFAGDPAPGYYAQVLTLFGAGWFDGRFRFGPDGALRTP